MRRLIARTGTVSALAIWVIYSSIDVAFACACCADPGYRLQTKRPISSYELEVLGRLEADGPANLYMTACGEDCISGINWSNENVETEFMVSGNMISITLNPGTQSQTVLTSKISQDLVYSAKDLNPFDGKVTVALDIEFQIPLIAHGTGPGWTGGAKTVSAELVLYGTGNACPDVAMVSYWLLDVGGPNQKVWFRLFGKFLEHP